MVRPMVQADKSPVMDIIRQTDMFTEGEIDVAEELIDIYFKDSGQKDYRVVVVENAAREVAGYMTWGPTPLAEGAYDLYWMAVTPKEQGRGLGKELVGWLEESVKKLGGRLIIIETSSQTKYHSTRRFYENLGYKEVARVPDFYKPGDDRIIFTKHFR